MSVAIVSGISIKFYWHCVYRRPNQHRSCYIQILPVLRKWELEALKIVTNWFSANFQTFANNLQAPKPKIYPKYTLHKCAAN